MEFKSEEEFNRVAKKAVQILLYVAETKSPLLRKLKAKNFISHIYNKNQNGTIYFELSIPFLVDDPDHGPFCKALDNILTAILSVFSQYRLNENMEFVTKTEEGDDMVGFFNSCEFNWSNHEADTNAVVNYGFEYNWYSSHGKYSL